MKKKYEFLRLSNSQSLQEVPKNLNRAFENFFQGRSRFPKFKKKKKINSISIPQNFKIIGNEIKISKLKVETIAGFWASKEAISKALGVGIGKKLSFKDIKIYKTKKGFYTNTQK